MQNQKMPKPLPFILSFLFVDLMLLGIMLCYQYYSSFEGFMVTLTDYTWIILLAAAFIAMVLAIILIKNYLALRNVLIASFMVMIFAFWFGISKTAMFGDGIKDNFMLFAGGSFLLTVINIGIQIDLLCAPSIKGFLTMDKKDRLAATAAPKDRDQAFDFEPEEEPPARNITKEHTAPAQRQMPEEKQNVQERKTASPRQAAVPLPNHATQQFDLNNLTEEQRKQLLDYQNQRRMARIAARQQMQRVSAKKQQNAAASQAGSAPAPQRRVVQNNNASANDYATQKFDTVERESLFFREEM